MTNNTATSVPKQDLVFTRIFDAPIEQAWKAWTEPEQVMRWWGPNGFTCPLARIDFRVGGTSLVCMRAPKDFGGQDLYSTWTYTRIAPMREIEYLHHFADKDGNRIDPSALGLPPDMPAEVRNVVKLKALGDRKTELAVTEYDWPIGHMMEMSKMGMEQCLDKMAASFANPSGLVMSGTTSSNSFRPSVTATLSVRNWARAIDFYKAAFGASELYRVPGGGVGQLTVSGLSSGSPRNRRSTSTSAPNRWAAARFECC